MHNISRSILLRMKDVSDKSCIENQNTILYSTVSSEGRSVYEIVWLGMVEADSHRRQYTNGACALHVGYLRIETHTQNM
jgi:hypothetical protein